MTNKLSPEQIAEMSEDCQCSCKELEQYKAWWERDSTSLGKALNEVSSLRAGKEQFRAAIDQLHAAVKTAQELAATRLMEIDRLHACWSEALGNVTVRNQEIEQLRAQLQQVVAIGFEAGVEAQKRSHEPCEQRNEVNSIDDVAAICHSVTGLCCHILGSPGGPCTIGNCAAVRGYLGGPEFAQGASRDASSALPEEQKALRVQCICGWQGKVGELTELSGRYLCPECVRPFEPMPTLRTNSVETFPEGK